MSLKKNLKHLISYISQKLVSTHKIIMLWINIYKVCIATLCLFNVYFKTKVWYTTTKKIYIEAGIDIFFFFRFTFLCSNIIANVKFLCVCDCVCVCVFLQTNLFAHLVLYNFKYKIQTTGWYAMERNWKRKIAYFMNFFFINQWLYIVWMQINWKCLSLKCI